MKLLDTSGGNTKLAKTNKGDKYRVAGLSLFPSDINCPARHVAECAESCLESAGRGRMSNVINGRQGKAAWFKDDQTAFLEQLNKELQSFAATCKRQGVKPAVRLNVISDIQWEKLGVPQLHPDIIFYDYTKLGKTPANYRLMFSYSGAPAYQNQVKQAVKTDVPMSVVFRGPLPAQFMGRPVIDGDISDLDNLFAGPVIVGLRAKGKAKKSESLFIVDTNIIARAVA